LASLPRFAALEKADWGDRRQSAMISGDFVRVPVVDADNQLVGIIARRDLLRVYLAGNSSKGK
jgi:CBS domain-containing protein